MREDTNSLSYFFDRERIEPSMQKIFDKMILVFVLTHFISVYSVPTSFLQFSQGNTPDISWKSLTLPPFVLYFDPDQKENAEYLMKGLVDSYPYISSLFGTGVGEDQWSKNLPIRSPFSNIGVIIGNRNEGPGFSNPATMNIESVQNLSRFQSFYQHELVHRLMYEHFDNFLGPVGRLLSIGTLPTWFIEGFPEFLTKSLGQKKTDDYLRSAALQNHWPTWERLHSLYNTNIDETLMGYAISGAFLEYLLQKTHTKNIYKFLNDISNHTKSFPFYNPVDQWIFAHTKMSPQENYNEFKKWEKEYWIQYTDNLPSIRKSLINQYLELETPQVFLEFKNKIILSQMTDSQNGFSSFILEAQPTKPSLFEKNKWIRMKIKTNGSNLFLLNENKNSYAVTTSRKFYKNAAYGDNLNIVYFQGDKDNFNSKNILKTEEIQFSTKEKPYSILDLQKKSKDEFYVATSLFGRNEIFLYRHKKKSFEKIYSVNIPGTIQFVTSTQNEICAKFILSTNNDATSLEQVCENKVTKTILPKNEWILNGVIDESNNNYLLLTYQDKLQSLIQIHLNPLNEIENKKILSIFTERLENIAPSQENSNNIFAWVYWKGKYVLVSLDKTQFNLDYENWKKSKPENIFSKIRKYPFYEDHYIQVFNQYTGINKEKIKDYSTNQDNKVTNIKTEDAKWDHSFFYLYPYGSFPPINESNISINAIPFQDKMERDFIQLSLQYLFNSNELNGSLNYVNRRILNEFSLGVYSLLRYNGQYSVENKVNGNITSISHYYDFLNEKGIRLHLSYQFRPAKISLFLEDTFSYLQPWSQNKNSSEESGPSDLFLNTLSPSLQLELFNHSFFESEFNYINSSANFLMGTKYFRSVGATHDAQGNNSDFIDSWNLNSLLSVTFANGDYNNTASLGHDFYLNLKGSFSQTLGTHTLNLKEWNTPFHPELLSKSFMNPFLNLTFLQNSSDGFLEQGNTSYFGNILFSKNLLPNFEKLFFISYLSTLNLNTMFTVSGVHEELSNKNTLHKSLTFGLDTLADIKGFQMIPSLNYSLLLHEKGWQIYFQLLTPNYL